MKTEVLTYFCDLVLDLFDRLSVVLVERLGTEIPERNWPENLYRFWEDIWIWVLDEKTSYYGHLAYFELAEP